QTFDDERETEWTPVWSLTEERSKYAATASCYFGYPFSPEHDFCRPDSNGNAAGVNLEEAILQGFLEVVERDAVALWWYNSARRLTEMNTFLAMAIAGELRRIFVGNTFEPAFLAPDVLAPIKTRRDYSPLQGEDLREDVRICVELASKRGLETLVLDQTRPDV